MIPESVTAEIPDDFQVPNWLRRLPTLVSATITGTAIPLAKADHAQ